MKLLKISMALVSSACAVQATLYESVQDFLHTTYNAASEHQAPIFVTGISAAAAAYVAYAIYLDGVINDKNSLWHWSIHHIQDGMIDQIALIEHVEACHPDLKSLHPLTAIFATAHAAQKEIDICLTLRGVLQNLKTVSLEWVMSETIASLDKKLECLYILKIMLSQCTVQTRTRCRKRALLN